MQPHDGLFPVRHLADAEAVAALLSQVILRADLFDANAEEFLNGILDLRLGSVSGHLEGVAASNRCSAFFMPPGADALRARAMMRALFGDQRAKDDLVRAQLWARRRQEFLALTRPRFEFSHIAL